VNNVSVLALLLAHPKAREAARGVSDWMDLQWSLLLEQLRSVAPQASGRLLDVGCGNKPYEHLFRPFISEYIGVEHEATFGETSASQAGGPDVFYDGLNLPFEDAGFDTVLNVQVLEHTPEPQRLLEEMSRVLRPGGLMILNAPFSFRLHEEPHDYFRYTPHGLRAMCERAGLEVIDVRPQGGFGSVIGHKLNSLLALRIARMQGLAQSLGKLGHEASSQSPPRLWLLPVVFPAMLGISAGARIFDRLVDESTEALSFLVLARKLGVPRE
jgi:SAM-dependent methyltransferase